MRYHTAKDILDVGDHGLDKSLFHNILVNPSLAPYQRNNPGISVMEVDDNTLIPHNYQATYLNLEPTIGRLHLTPYQSLHWRDIDYNKDFGLEDLTPQGIHNLRIKLQKDLHLQHDFMIRKIGLDPNDHFERH